MSDKKFDVVRDWIDKQVVEADLNRYRQAALKALDWLHSDLEQQIADLKKRIAELEAQLQDEKE